MVMAAASDLATLDRVARDIALTRAADSTHDAGIVFVRVPPAWLAQSWQAQSLLRWCLLFGTAERRDLMETYALAKTLLEADPDARVGLTIHGVRRIAQAETAFRRVSEVTQRRLGRALLSYGLLVDDLHIYRAIVARRPIGLEHPQSRAARALQDVARLIIEDARKYSLA
jgi:MinD-like ATPase involved in chromosome partitioning or flagellar assembly